MIFRAARSFLQPKVHFKPLEKSTVISRLQRKFSNSFQARSAWNTSAPTGQILMKFEICVVFRKSLEKIQVSLKSDKNNGYFR